MTTNYHGEHNIVELLGLRIDEMIVGVGYPIVVVRADLRTMTTEINRIVLLVTTVDGVLVDDVLIDPLVTPRAHDKRRPHHIEYVAQILVKRLRPLRSEYDL